MYDQRVIHVLWSVCLCASASAAEPTYWNDVRPALRRYCTVCHSVRNLAEVDISGGFTLDSYEAVLKNAKKPLLKPGKSGESLIVQLVVTADTDKRMPLGAKPLPDDVVALLKRWIDAGAPEGTRPTSETTVRTPESTKPRRKLDVAFSTTAVPTKGVLGAAAPAPLQLVVREGPLPPVTAVAFNPAGDLLATGAYGYAAVWDLKTGLPRKVLTGVLGTVNDLRFSPDGTLLAVAGGQPSAKGDLRLYAVADWKLVATLGGHEDVVASVAFSPDGKRLASASFDRTVRIWDVATHKTELAITSHSDFVYSVAWSPKGDWLVSASKDKSVKLTDAATGKGRFTFSGMNEDVMAVAVLPDGKAVVSSGIESAIYWWDPATGSRTRVQGGHGAAVNELCFSRDGKVLASASTDGTAKLWNPTTLAILATLGTNSAVYATAISADGKRAATGSYEGLVRLWDATNGRLLVTLLTVAPRGAEPEWLALTPEGYASASAKLSQGAQWRMGKEPVATEATWKALGKPEIFARAVRGEVVPPVFGK